MDGLITVKLTFDNGDVGEFEVRKCEVQTVEPIQIRADEAYGFTLEAVNQGG